MHKKFKKFLTYFFVFFFLITSIFPIYYLFVISSLSWAEFRYSKTPNFLPSTSNLKLIFFSFFQKTYLNSLIISFSVTLISIILGTAAGYSFAKYKIGGFFLPFSILSIRMLPVIAFIIPLFIFSQKLNIIDTYYAVILSHLIICLPYSIWMMRSFFIEVPIEIQEAANVDGCNSWQIFYKISIPLVAPGIAVTSLFCFIFSWNEFIFGLVLTRKEAIPITVNMSGGSNYSLALASILPVLLFSILINKHLVRGITLGAIK